MKGHKHYSFFVADSVNLPDIEEKIIEGKRIIAKAIESGLGVKFDSFNDMMLNIPLIFVIESEEALPQTMQINGVKTEIAGGRVYTVKTDYGFEIA